MNDWWDTLTGFLAICWYIYVLVMGVVMLLGVRSLLDFVMGIFAIWILLVLPAVIRGRW